MGAHQMGDGAMHNRGSAIVRSPMTIAGVEMKSLFPRLGSQVIRVSHLNGLPRLPIDLVRSVVQNAVVRIREQVGPV